MFRIHNISLNYILTLFLSWILYVPFVNAQSGTFGNTWIAGGSEMSLFSTHNFQTGGNGIFAGIVGTERTSAVGFLSFLGSATHTGASNTAYVDGYVRSYETGEFVFPVGDNNVYAPVHINSASINMPTDVAYFHVSPSIATTSSLKGGNELPLPNGAPFNTSALGIGLEKVSNIGYWDINGSVPTQISLSWSTDFDINTLTGTNLSLLTIIGWDGSKWVPIPSNIDIVAFNISGASSYSTGSITTTSSITPSSYSVYSLGKLVPPLPILLTNNCTSNTVDLTTAVGLNGVLPSGTLLTWHSGTPASNVNKINTPNSVGSGSYYAAFFDAINNCYSPTSVEVIVSIVVCVDTDGDTIADTIDLDDDNDGILDTIENAQLSADTDGDGIPNSLDLDSDNDGINDVIEAGGIDANNDGIADGTSGLTGIPASANQLTGTIPPDSDLDTRANPYDLDSDNDGINDIIESGNPALIDANGDGIVDGTDPDGDGIVGVADGSLTRGDNNDPTPVNTDSTGEPDYLDTDSDDDGLSDLLESGIASAATLDVNRDGRVDVITDLDGDGIVTLVDGSATYGDANNPALPDSNTNGIPDYREANPDIDGDGVTNAQEITDGTDYSNGCSYNPSNQVLANTSTTWRNSDCDGDGVTNYKEATGTDNNAATTADNTNPLDGCSYNAVDQVLSNTSPLWKVQDCDKDGNPNGTDPHPQVPTALDDALVAKYGTLSTVNVLLNDDFLLGLTTTITQTGGTAAGTVLIVPTTGILSYTPTLAERGTTVTVTYQVCNTAVIPSICANATVNITVPADTDADGVPDVDDLDDDNDGILDTVENAQLSADIDSDGIPNRLDLDSDNDGINDVDEANGTDDNGDGMADGVVSVTGIPTTAGTGLIPPDTDNDAKPNPYDLDSDNDGAYDLEEGGLNPNLDANGDGIVDCSTNCDPDGDGILTPVDGLPNDWKDTLLPDLTPTTEINSLEFLTAGASRDFVVNVFEINNKPNVSGSTIVFRVAKISGFTITYPSTSGTSDVFVGGTANSNSDWTFTENSNFIIVTAKAGVVIPPNGKKTVGFTATRKTDVPSNTSQNITVTIIYGSAGEEKVSNNTVETKITAN